MKKPASEKVTKKKSGTKNLLLPLTLIIEGKHFDEVEKEDVTEAFEKELGKLAKKAKLKRHSVDTKAHYRYYSEQATKIAIVYCKYSLD